MKTINQYSGKALVYLALAMGITVTNAFEQLELQSFVSSEQVLLDPAQFELRDEAAMNKYN